MGIAGKRVVVVGGSSGIGLALAKEASARGAEVVITGRDQAKLEKAAAEVGGPVEAASFDVVDEPAVAAFFGRVGSLDHVAVMAGDLVGGMVTQADAAAVRPAMDVRFWGSFHVAKHATPRVNEGGSITFCSGVAAWKPIVGEAVAAASAGAAEAFGRSLAVELAPIRVNTVCPGFVDTPLLDAVLGEQRDAIVAAFEPTLPVKRIGRPEEVADAVLFLMGNGFVTGATLHVDGGHQLV